MVRILFREVVEAAPALAAADIAELLEDFLFSVAGAFNDLPEGDELVEADLAVVVDVDGVKELASGDLSKRVLPVVQGLFLIDGVARVNVEDSKDLVHLLKALRG